MTFLTLEMRVKAVGVFRSKLFKPCKKHYCCLNQFITYKSSLTLCSQVQIPKAIHKFKSSMLLSILRSPKRSKDKGRLPDLKSPLNIEHETLPFPSYSPLAPAYARACCVDKREASLQVEETCKKFENYLVEMIVEEGKMRDLMDVKELPHCWKNLKCPVFIELVCRFNVEICKDLFSFDSEEASSNPTNG